MYPTREPPPKGLLLEKMRAGIDALITILQDKVDGEVFEAAKAR